MSAEEIVEPVITDPIPENEAVEVSYDDPEISIDEPEPQAQENEDEDFDPKKDFVEFNEKQQARFNEVFRQLKKSDQRNEMLTDFLQKQQEVIDEIRGNMSQTNEAEAEKVLMSKISEARELGDDDAYDKAFTELVDFRAERQIDKKFDEKINKLIDQEKQQERAREKFVLKAMEEVDEMTGEYKRPWLQESNEKFPLAFRNIQKIAKEYEGDPLILEKTLAKLDQVMSSEMAQGGQTMTKKTTEQPKNSGMSRVQNPMSSSNLTNQQTKGKIKMTRQELDLLQKLERHSGKKIDLKKYAARRDGGQ